MAGSSEKSEGAFRTIREVADWLGVPTHVLRFWESKFDQIAPVKGAGGRRYYRPEDMRLLGGIKVMLHDQGLTVRGVAKRIEDGGIGAVTALSPELEARAAPATRPRKVIRQHPEPGDDRVIPFERRDGDATEPDPAAPPAERGEPASPAQPDAPVTPEQPDAPATPRQPDDSPIVEPGPPPQPDIPDDDPAAPGPGPTQPSGDAGRLVLRVGTAMERRRLRRVIHRLRGMIADVEEELVRAGRPEQDP